MKRIPKILSPIIILLISGCIVSRISEKREEKVRKCRISWEYSKLRDTQEIRVIYFQEYLFFGKNYAPLMIGVNANNDTTGYIDLECNHIYQIGDTLTIEPFPLENTRKLVKPLYIIPKQKKIQKIICAVRKVKYCKWTNCQN